MGSEMAKTDRQVLWSQESVIDNANIQIRFAGLNESDTFDPVVHNSGVFRITQTASNHVVDNRWHCPQLARNQRDNTRNGNRAGRPADISQGK